MTYTRYQVPGTRYVRREREEAGEERRGSGTWPQTYDCGLRLALNTLCLRTYSRWDIFAERAVEA